MFRAISRLSTALAAGLLVVATVPALAQESARQPPVARSASPDPASPPAHYVTVLHDDFDDGERIDAAKWSTVAGIWRGEDGVLVTSVPIPLRLDRPIFPPILSPAERPLGISPAPLVSLAAIASNTPIDNAFRIEIVLSGRGVAPATINLGPYLGGDADSGYRLVYDGEHDRPLKLISSNRGKVATVAAATPEADLYNGDPHSIVWTRDAFGRMTVAVDGHGVLEATDRSIAPGFDGFSMVNAGGRWGIDSVVVQNQSEALGY